MGYSTSDGLWMDAVLESLFQQLFSAEESCVNENIPIKYVGFMAH